MELQQDFRILFFEKRYDIIVADKAVQCTTLTTATKMRALESMFSPNTRSSCVQGEDLLSDGVDIIDIETGVPNTAQVNMGMKDVR